MNKKEIKELSKKFVDLSKDLKRRHREIKAVNDPLKSDIEYDKLNNIWYKKHNYENLKVLGSGTFGTTYLARDINTGKNFVLKDIQLKADNLQDIFNEIAILKKIAKYGCKANLLCFVEYYLDYEKQRMYIVTDVFENSMTLRKFIDKYQKCNKIINTYKLLKIMKGLLKAIVYLHKLGIAHADLKPENIIINDKLEVQIIDFGISCTKNCIVLGTLLYQSPELIRISKTEVSVNLLKRGDIFSLGMVFYLLANLEFPYKVEDNRYSESDSEGDFGSESDYDSESDSDSESDLDSEKDLDSKSDSDSESECISILKEKTPLERPKLQGAPVVKLEAQMYTLNEFYKKIGGFLTAKERMKLKESGKEEPKNLMMSYYSDQYKNVDDAINELIIKMLDTNFKKRPLAKHCMSMLNKIIKMYNDIQKNIISPGIESPIFEELA